RAVVPGRPIVCPLLVGREQELRTLARCLDDVAARRGGVVLVAGEAGVGKTRVVAELRRMAAERGVPALVGHSFENDRSAPYAPVIDLLRAFAPAPTDETRRSLGPVAADLSALLPELRDWFLGVEPPRLEPEHRARALVHAVLRFFDQLTAEQPRL